MHTRHKRILLVDDHPLMCEAIAKWIEQAPELEVCGSVDSAAAALSAVGRLKPDLALVDIVLPGRNGLGLIKALRAAHSEVPIVVYSMHEESFYGACALRAGARGYVNKRSGGEHLVRAIRKVLRGELAYSQILGAHIMEQISKGHKQPSESTLPLLSDRELEIFQAIGELKGTREISLQLHLSPKTVETHRLNIKGKLNLKTSAELLRVAVQHVSA